MMELSFKSKSIKKRVKKKKICVSESALVPLLKLDAIDGVSNWVRMQKLIGPITEGKSKKKSGIKMLKIEGVSQNSKDSRLPFSQKSTFSRKNSIQSSSEKQKQVTVKSDQQNGGDKLVNDELSNKLEQLETAKKNENQPYAFNFSKNSDNLSRNSPSKNSSFEAKGNKYAEKRLTKAIAMDCEMVGTGPKGEESIIARVSIVNAFGVCLYDEFVKPMEKVTDFRTKISGVRPSDLKHGKELFEVQKDVLSIIEGRILVGHAIKHDLDVLFISHPRHLIRDTAFYKPFRDLCGGKTPSLKKLTSKILGCDIQSGEHSSIEDAQAAMLLYLRVKKDWEKDVGSRRKRKPKNIDNQIEI